MARDILVFRPEEFASLPVIKAYWGHGYRDYDVWLPAKQAALGLLWVFECPHGKWLLIGARATVGGPTKKKWNQAVLSLPPQHKSCEYTLYSPAQWQLEDDDPLRHFDVVPVKFKGVRWYYGDIDVYLTAQHTNYSAKLFFTLHRKIAHVTFEFPFSSQFYFEPFEVDYRRAVDLFLKLFCEGRLEKLDIIDQGLYSSLIQPNAVFEMFSQELQ
jgi:hypothetical protein